MYTVVSRVTMKGLLQEYLSIKIIKDRIIKKLINPKRARKEE